MIFKAKPKFDQLDQYLGRREYNLALEAITDEIKRRPENFNLLLRQAEILGLAGDRDKAIEVYRQLAHHYTGEGFYARAIAVTNKILRLDPMRKEVTEELAGLIAAQQEAERASRKRLDQAAMPTRLGLDGTTAPAESTGAERSDELDEDVVVIEEEPAGAEAVADRQEAPAACESDEIPPEQAAREREAGRFFSAFPRPALEELLSSTSVLSYNAGDVIMFEGAPGTSMFLIADGRVEVHTRDTAGMPLVLATLGPGEFFGEVAMLTGRPRTATVVALDRVTVVETSREDVDRLVASYPEVREVIERFLVERAQATTDKMLARLRGERA
ncbi:MAG: cyclic nucleotide-binding domain-containing protein [Acidobacteriota bacterium]